MSHVDVHIYPSASDSFRIVAVVEPEEMLLGAEEVRIAEGLALVRAARVANIFEHATGLRAQVIPYEETPSWDGMLEADVFAGFSGGRTRSARESDGRWRSIARKLR